jgi:hypothetical protein
MMRTDSPRDCCFQSGWRQKEKRKDQSEMQELQEKADMAETLRRLLWTKHEGDKCSLY